MIVSTDTMHARWSGAWRGMREAGYACLIVAGSGTIGAYGALQFLTGFFATTRGAFAVLHLDSPPVLLLRSEEERRGVLAEGSACAALVAMNATGVEYAAAVGRTARSALPGRIGAVGFDCVSASAATAIAASLGATTLSDATPVLAVARRVKSAEDWVQLRRAGDLAEGGLRFAIASARVGMTECELAGGIEALARSRGAQLVLVYVSRGEFVGRRPLPGPIAAADLLTVFVELAVATGHWVELGIALAMPEVTQGARLAGSCIDALRHGAAGLAAGSTSGAVAAGMLDVLRDADLSASINLGHGVGIDEEPPTIVRGSIEVIADPSAIALHPSAAPRDLSDGCAVANTYVVDGRGTQPLSDLPHALHRAAG